MANHLLHSSGDDHDRSARDGHSGSTVYPAANTVEDLERNLAAVTSRIALACARAHRPTDSVRLLPVSKTVDEHRVRLAYKAGCRLLGENKVQEASRKSEAMSDLPDLQWSVIGHLQTNKAKTVARFAAEFHALDSLRVAEALDRRLQQEGRGLDVYIQVNTSGEQSKYGLLPDAVAGFIREIPHYSALRIRGLMTLAVLSTDPVRIRPCFTSLRGLRDQLRQSAPDGVSLDELSMGMSGDFELAIEEGATVVRVGQAIFGERSLPDSYYWPSDSRPSSR